MNVTSTEAQSYLKSPFIPYTATEDNQDKAIEVITEKIKDLSLCVELPPEIKIHVTHFISKYKWFALHNLLMTNKAWYSIQQEAFRKRSDLVNKILEKAKGNFEQLPVRFQEIFADHDFCNTIDTLDIHRYNSETISKIFQNFQSYANLNMNGTLLQNNELLSLLENKSKLISLSLTDCKNLSNEGFCTIIQQHSNLTSLGLFQTKITPTGLQAIGNLEQLKTLALGFARRLEDETLKRLLQKCTKLKEVRIISCDKVTKEYMTELRNTHPKISFTLIHSSGKRL